MKCTRTTLSIEITAELTYGEKSRHKADDWNEQLRTAERQKAAYLLVSLLTKTRLARQVNQLYK